MNITVSTKPSASSKNSCLVIAVGSGALSGTAKTLNTASNGAIKRAMQRGDFDGKSGKTLMLHELTGSHFDRVLLAGCGRYRKVTAKDYRSMSKALAKALINSGTENATLTVPTDLEVDGHDEAWQVQQLTEALLYASYQFTGHTRSEKHNEASLKKTVIQVAKATSRVKAYLARGLGNGSGISLARDLGNLAPNICTPRYLAKRARALARTHPALRTTVLGDKELNKLGMNAFLAVSQGSTEPAQLICMNYQGGKTKDKPIVLVGKGVTFDTGGISIKPSAAMDEMKFDMCGAASVFGVIEAVCRMKLNCNIVGVVAAAENMPDANATRPGDVIDTMSGQSIEVLNTDAEGRMVLCDTLTYVKRYKPKAVIDVATLTGACIVALGHVASAVMANDDTLSDALIEAGETSGDRTWPLPLWDEYQEQLDSNFADIANIGGKGAGSITAGCFLSRFAQEYSWAHLDIAGIAWHGGAQKGATGRPVPLLMQYLVDQV